MAGLQKRNLIASQFDVMDTRDRASAAYQLQNDAGGHEKCFEVHIYHALELLETGRLSSQSQEVSKLLLRRPPSCHGLLIVYRTCLAGPEG